MVKQTKTAYSTIIFFAVARPSDGDSKWEFYGHEGLGNAKDMIHFETREEAKAKAAELNQFAERLSGKGLGVKVYELHSLIRSDE